MKIHELNSKWDKLDDETKLNILLKYVKDVKEAEKLSTLDFYQLPDYIIVNIQQNEEWNNI